MLTETARVLVAVVVALTMPSSGVAQGGAGSVRLGLDTSLVSVDVSEEESGDLALARGATFVGLGGGGIGADFGFEVADRLLLGARAAFGTRTTGDTTAWQVFLALYGEVAFRPRRFVRPAVRGFIGFLDEAATVGAGPTMDSATLSALAFGGGFAVHFFATSTFAITPVVLVAHGKGSIDAPGSSADGLDVGFTVAMVVLELSGWLGGSSGRDQPSRSSAEGARGGDESTVPEDVVLAEIPLAGAVLDMAATYLEPNVINVRVVLENTAVGGDCPVVTFSGTSESRTSNLRARRAELAGRPARLITLHTDRATLEAFIASSPPLLGVCGTTWSLDRSAVSVLEDFLRRLTDEAVAHGTMDQSAAEPLDAAEDAQDARGTDAAEDPVSEPTLQAAPTGPAQ